MQIYAILGPALRELLSREGAEPTPKAWRGGGQRQKEQRENQEKFHRAPDKVPGQGGGSGFAVVEVRETCGAGRAVSWSES